MPGHTANGDELPSAHTTIHGTVEVSGTGHDGLTHRPEVLCNFEDLLYVWCVVHVLFLTTSLTLRFGKRFPAFRVRFLELLYLLCV
jgi:hypothetical protein